MKPVSSFRAVLFICVLGTTVHAQDAIPVITGADILDHGIYSTTLVSTVKNPDSPTSQVLTQTTKLISATQMIPAKIGTTFGFHFIIHGNPKGVRANLRAVFLFPPMTNATTGQAYTRFEANITAPLEDNNAAMYYDLTHTWEVVPGKWTFQIFDHDKKLLEEEFTLVPQ